MHLPDHARGAAGLDAAELADLPRPRLGEPAIARPTRALPRTKQEVAYWNKWVAEGWADGEKQAVEIFLADLGRLERDIVGMARYRVLLRAGLVEPPNGRVPERRPRTADVTACMSATRRSASPTSRACRAIRAAGRRAPGARNERQDIRGRIRSTRASLSPCLIAGRARRASTPCRLAGRRSGRTALGRGAAQERARSRFAARLGLPRGRVPHRVPDRAPGVGRVFTAATTASTRRAIDEIEFSQIVNHLYGADGMARLQGGNDFDTAYAIRSTDPRGCVSASTRRRRAPPGVTAATSCCGRSRTCRRRFGDQRVEQGILDAYRPRQGMVIVSGATGSGKSTLIAVVPVVWTGSGENKLRLVAG